MTEDWDTPRREPRIRRPQIEITDASSRFLKRACRAPVACGLFGWGTDWWNVRYLVDVGYVTIFYDWSDRRTKAELTDAGRAYVERKATADRTVLTTVG